jgi:tetratricopeptide (TPR) repeat protein
MPRKMPRSAPPTTFRAARGADSRSHLASALPGGRKSPNIHPRSGLIWEIPVNIGYSITNSRPSRPAASAAPVAPTEPGKLSTVMALCADARKLLLEDRFYEARQVVQQALRLKPTHAAAVYILGLIEMASGSLEEAAKVIKRTTELEPKVPDPYYFLGVTYEQLGRHEEAAEAFRAALAIKPDLQSALDALIQALGTSGRQEEAIEVVRRRLSLEPEDIGAYVHLSRMDPHALAPAEISRLEATAASSEVKVRAAFACFALAKVFEARRDYDRSFAYLKRGNDLYRDLLTETDGKLPSQMVLPVGAVPRRLAPAKALQELARSTAQVEITFDKPFLDRYAGFGHPSSLPIFIVGMPRSGSTLIEQILSSHPLVHGAGELYLVTKHLAEMHWPFAGYLLQSAEGVRTNPPPAPPNRYFRQRGAAYVKALRGYNARAQRIVDKMPGNYIYLGMIHLCLPKATIIHSVRDPLDTCLGCYKQLFATGNETTFDMAMIGQHYQRYRRLMDHWQRVLPGRVIEVVYERLVADPESEIRRLLAACGLPWHEGCLRFHETQRPVRTASMNQVRQPIFKSAVGRWRRYEKHLGPLLEALGPYAPAQAAS